MSGDLEKTGVRLVAEGADDFFGTLRSAAKAIQEFANTAGKQAGLTGFAQDIKTVSSALKSIGSESKSASTTVKKANEDVAKSAGEVATKVTAAASATQNAGSVAAIVATNQSKLGLAYQDSVVKATQAAIRVRDAGDAARKAAADSSTSAAEQQKLNLAYQKASVDAQNASLKVRDTGKAYQESRQSTSTFAISLGELGSKFAGAGDKAKDAAGKILSFGSGAAVGGIKDLGTATIATVGALGKLAGEAGSGAVTAIRGLGSAAGTTVGALAKLGSTAGGVVVGGLQGIAGAALAATGNLIALGVRGAEAAGRFAVSFGKDAVKAAMDFDAQMSEVAAVADATPAQLAAMSEQALHLGAVFPVSANDAAKAMSELAKAGFNAQQTIDASSGVVQLASATHYKMADSATYLANAINQFGLKATDANRVTDLLAQSANASAVDVKDLAQTFAYVGPVAQAAGFSIEDVAKATSVMGNAGIKGSSAGTGLKAVLAQLVAPGDKAAAAFDKLGYNIKDATGKTKPLQQQLIELRSKFKDLSSADKIDLATQIVGKDHMSKLLALMNATDDSFNAVSVAIDNAGGAGQRMADTMNDNLAGAIQNLQGSFETLQIKAGKAFEPVLKDLANLGSAIINKTIPYVDIFAKKFQAGMARVKTTVGDLYKSWGIFKAAFTNGFQVPKGWTGAVATMGRLGSALAPLGPAFKDLLDAIKPSGDALGNLTGSGKLADLALSGVAFTAKNVLAPAMEGAAIAIGKIKQAFADAQKGWDIFKAGFNGSFQVPAGWTGLVGTMGRLGEALAPLKGAISDLVTAILPAATPAQAMADAMNNSGTAAKNAHPVIDAIGWTVKNVLVPGIEGAAKTIDNMQLAFGKLQGVIGPIMPQVGDFAKKAWEVYQAVSPLNIALDVFNGVMTGGLGGGIDAVGQHVTDLGKAFGVDLSGPVSTVTGYLKTDLVPTIGGIVSGFATALPKVIEFGQGILNQVLPPVQSFIGWIGEHVGPVVSSAFNTFSTEVLPDLKDFAGFIGSEVMPKVGDLIKFVGEKVGPIFEKGFGILADPVIPTLGKLVGVITGDVMPILFSWWNILGTALKPAFEALAFVVSNVVLPAVKLIWGFINDPLIPIFKTVAGIVQDPVMKIFQSLADLFNGAVKGAIDTVKGVWDNLMETIKKGGDIIGAVASGDWGKAWDLITSKANTGAQDAFKAVSKLNTDIGQQDFSGSAKKAGATIGQGLKAGIESSAAGVVAAASNIAQQAISAAKSKLSSQSPSKVFIEIGEDVGAGFAIGLDNNSPLVANHMDGLVGDMTKVVEDKRNLFRWTINDYLSPIPEMAQDIDKLNPDINLSLKEMLKGFAQTVVEQSGGFKTALDGFISPVAGMKDRLGTVIGQVKDEVSNTFKGVGQAVKDHNSQIVQDMKVLPDTVEQTGQDVAGAGSSPGGPVEAMKAVLTGIEQVIDSESGVITAKLNALLAQINSILAQIGQATASLAAIGSAAGPSGVPVPGGEQNPGSRSPNPNPGSNTGGGGGGSFQPAASASQILNMYNNSLSNSSSNNSPVVKNYNLGGVYTNQSAQSVQQSFAILELMG